MKFFFQKTLILPFEVIAKPLIHTFGIALFFIFRGICTLYYNIKERIGKIKNCVISIAKNVFKKTTKGVCGTRHRVE